jgi:hypothetical protein
VAASVGITGAAFSCESTLATAVSVIAALVVLLAQSKRRP